MLYKGYILLIIIYANPAWMYEFTLGKHLQIYRMAVILHRSFCLETVEEFFRVQTKKLYRKLENHTNALIRALGRYDTSIHITNTIDRDFCLVLFCRPLLLKKNVTNSSRNTFSIAQTCANVIRTHIVKQLGWKVNAFTSRHLNPYLCGITVEISLL